MKDVKSGILRRLANGQDFKASCQAVGISRQKGYRMRNADPGFDAQVKRLQDERRPTKEEYAFEMQNKREAARQEGTRHIERPELQQPPIPEKVIEYGAGSIQYEPGVKLANDASFKPGMQPAWRQRQLELQDEIDYNQRRNRFYSNPWNWHRPFRDNL